MKYHWSVRHPNLGILYIPEQDRHLTFDLEFIPPGKETKFVDNLLDSVCGFHSNYTVYWRSDEKVSKTAKNNVLQNLKYSVNEVEFLGLLVERFDACCAHCYLKVLYKAKALGIELPLSGPLNAEHAGLLMLRALSNEY